MKIPFESFHEYFTEKLNIIVKDIEKLFKEEKTMPVRKVKGGYKYGNKGKVYKEKWKAERQGRAIKASQARKEKEVK